MAALSATWTTKTVQITYRNPLTLLKETGNWVAETTGRVTNTLSDGRKQVFRPGKFAGGTLSTVEDASPSFSVDIPVIDDPDNSPQGGSVKLTISFNSGGGEVFTLLPSSSWPTVTDIGNILDPTITPSAPTYVMKGVAGGVAALDTDGYVLDASGARVTGGSGGSQGSVTIALLPAGLSYKVIWNDTTKKWYYNGNEITGRLNNRNDLYIDFIGGRETDRPSWGQINGDTQEVTIA